MRCIGPFPVQDLETSGLRKWVVELTQKGRRMASPFIKLYRVKDYRTVTTVPTGTRSYRSFTCSFIIRMQPLETERPMELGWVVP